MKYRYSMDIGDWSGDGHCENKTHIFSCSHSKEDIIKAYKEAVEKCKVSLHYAGDSSVRDILCDYEDRTIQEEELKALTDLGCQFKYRDYNFDDGTLDCSPHDVFCLFMEMVGTQISNFKWREEKTPESINVGGNFCTVIGYGVY